MNNFVLLLLLSFFLPSAFGATPSVAAASAPIAIQRLNAALPSKEAASPGQQLKLQLSKPLADGQSIVDPTLMPADPISSSQQRSGLKDHYDLIPLEKAGDSAFFKIPDDIPPGNYNFHANVKPGADGRATDELLPTYSVEISGVSQYALFAALPLIALFVIPTLLKHNFRSRRGERRRSLLTLVFIDPNTNSFSLSRAQFVWWSAIIIWAYLFIFLSQGFILDHWEFPVLKGFGYTFLISLSTLLAAQATAQGKGSMGSGEDAPLFSDFFMHGGVVALDRVQQVMWNLIGGVMYVSIIYQTYSLLHGLPDIPQELLTIMGLSSAGYVGGKMIRRAGPNALQANLNSDNKLVIDGSGFSPDAFVWLDGKQLSKDTDYTINMSTDADKSYPDFATKITVTDALKSAGCADVNAWNQSAHTITVINSDGQRTDLTVKAKPAV